MNRSTNLGSTESTDRNPFRPENDQRPRDLNLPEGERREMEKEMVRRPQRAKDESLPQELTWDSIARSTSNAPDGLNLMVMVHARKFIAQKQTASRILSSSRIRSRVMPRLPRRPRVPTHD